MLWVSGLSSNTGGWHTVYASCQQLLLRQVVSGSNVMLWVSGLPSTTGEWHTLFMLMSATCTTTSSEWLKCYAVGEWHTTAGEWSSI
jgi:hypothetical protein